jgi:hypothetical protein
MFYKLNAFKCETPLRRIALQVARAAEPTHLRNARVRVR